MDQVQNPIQMRKESVGFDKLSQILEVAPFNVTLSNEVLSHTPGLKELIVGWLVGWLG